METDSGNSPTQCDAMILVNGDACRCEYWNMGDHVSHLANWVDGYFMVSIRWGGGPANIARQVQRDMERRQSL